MLTYHPAKDALYVKDVNIESLEARDQESTKPFTQVFRRLYQGKKKKNYNLVVTDVTFSFIKASFRSHPTWNQGRYPENI